MNLSCEKKLKQVISSCRLSRIATYLLKPGTQVKEWVGSSAPATEGCLKNEGKKMLWAYNTGETNLILEKKIPVRIPRWHSCYIDKREKSCWNPDMTLIRMPSTLNSKVIIFNNKIQYQYQRHGEAYIFFFLKCKNIINNYYLNKSV